MIPECLIQREIARKIGGKWRILAVAEVPIPFLYRSKLFSIKAIARSIFISVPDSGISASPPTHSPFNQGTRIADFFVYMCVSLARSRKQINLKENSNIKNRNERKLFLQQNNLLLEFKCILLIPNLFISEE